MGSVDYDQIAPRYEDGRRLLPDTLRAWREAVTPFIPTSVRGPVLDLGAGTGMWAEALADWFGTEVVTMEPSASMRREGHRFHVHARWVGGVAERIPLGDASCGGAWLSTVIHYLDDVRAAAHEIRRVLASGAPVLIRSAFPGRLDEIPLFDYFPEARRIVEVFPTLDATTTAFVEAGFTLRAVRTVTEAAAPSLAEYARMARTRSDSTLVRLSNQEYQQGLARLDRALRAEREPVPVRDRVDLLAFR